MSNLDIVFREMHCRFADSDSLCQVCGQCYTDYATDLGCSYYRGDEVHDEWINGEKVRVIPCGGCVHADYRYIYKGFIDVEYEMEKSTDPYDPLYMEAWIDGERYECVKVSLNGKTIYNEYDDDDDGCDEEEGGTE